MLGWSRRHDLSTKSTRSLGVLVLPILAYCLVALIGGNSFVAAFVAGTAFTAKRRPGSMRRSRLWIGRRAYPNCWGSRCGWSSVLPRCR